MHNNLRQAPPPPQLRQHYSTKYNKYSPRLPETPVIGYEFFCFFLNTTKCWKLWVIENYKSLRNNKIWKLYLVVNYELLRNVSGLEVIRAESGVVENYASLRTTSR